VAGYSTASDRGRDGGANGTEWVVVMTVSDTFRGPPPTGGYMHLPVDR